jgi:membrane-bound metal-dependent hydrolase YbcI (DUF457 family)
MRGYSHALTGAVVGLGAGVVLHLGITADTALSGFTAGMALLPDLDSCGSSGARSLGLISGAVSHAVRRASGGHRHATHSVLGIAVFAGLAFLACAFRRDWAGIAGLALLLVIAVAGALEALHVARGHAADVAGIAVAAAVAGYGYGLALIPLAVVLGCSAHIAGDMLTDCGCPLAWPSMRHYWLLPRPLRFTTGHWPETRVVVPVLFLALAVLAVTAAEPSAWHLAGRL